MCIPDKPSCLPPDGTAGSVKAAADFFKGQIRVVEKAAKADKAPPKATPHQKNIKHFENKAKKSGKDHHKKKAKK